MSIPYLKIISFRNLPFEDYIAKQKKYNLDYDFFFSQMMKGNAPLNWDADSKKQAKKILKKLKNSKYNKGHYQILWRKSSSRRGYHFTVFKDGKLLFLPIKKILRIRKIYKDCLGRLKCDRQRAKSGLCISILFNTKNSKFVTAWRDLSQLKL